MHWNASFDQYAMHRGLDLAAWDEYIPSGRADWADTAAQHDLVRGYKQKNFWVMETQPAFVNWWPVNRALDPGQVREMVWQAVGHGADAAGFWQWRSALNGQEQYHGTLARAGRRSPRRSTPRSPRSAPTSTRPRPTSPARARTRRSPC